MAPLPKRKLSRQRGRERMMGQRRAAKTMATLISCPNCKKIIPAHQICRFCGYYKGQKMA